MSKKRKSIIVHDQEVCAGERKLINVPLPRFYDWTPLSMPVHVIHGEKKGPCLLVTAAVHGDEVNGVAIIRRLMKKKALKHISGTLITVPIMNIYGFLMQDRYVTDRRDLNRSFPGSAHGSLASRIAHLIVNELVEHATHMIDLHTGSNNRSNLPQIRANLDMKGVRIFAQSFQAPIIMNAQLRDGSLRQYACDKGIPLLLYEAGEALRFDEVCINTGISGVLNAMYHLKMIARKPATMRIMKSPISRKSYWVRSKESGLFRPFVQLGKTVKEGEVIAIISNPTNADEFSVVAPIDGIIIGKNNLPLVNEGSPLFHIACVKLTKRVINTVDLMQESFGETPDSIYRYQQRGD